MGGVVAFKTLSTLSLVSSFELETRLYDNILPFRMRASYHTRVSVRQSTCSHPSIIAFGSFYGFGHLASKRHSYASKTHLVEM